MVIDLDDQKKVRDYCRDKSVMYLELRDEAFMNGDHDAGRLLNTVASIFMEAKVRVEDLISKVVS